MRVVSVGAIVLLLSAGGVAGAQTKANEPVEITLQRTACFGTCPEYTVTLKDDGTVVYSGRQFVKTPGEHTWKIEAAAVRGLAREMAAAGFFELQDAYTALMTDNPTTYTSLRIGSRTKNRMAAEEKIKLLEKDPVYIRAKEAADIPLRERD